MIRNFRGPISVESLKEISFQLNSQFSILGQTLIIIAKDGFFLREQFAIVEPLGATNTTGGRGG